MLLKIIKYLMAYHYVTNTRFSFESNWPYKFSSYLGVAKIICVIDSFLFISFPYVNEILYDFYYAVGFIMSPLIILIAPYFIRKKVTKEELIQYINTLEEKKLRLHGTIYSLLIMFFLWASIYYNGKYYLQ